MCLVCFHVRASCVCARTSKRTHAQALTVHVVQRTLSPHPLCVARPTYLRIPPLAASARLPLLGKVHSSTAEGPRHCHVALTGDPQGTTLTVQQHDYLALDSGLGHDQHRGQDDWVKIAAMSWWEICMIVVLSGRREGAST